MRFAWYCSTSAFFASRFCFVLSDLAYLLGFVSCSCFNCFWPLLFVAVHVFVIVEAVVLLLLLALVVVICYDWGGCCTCSRGSVCVPRETGQSRLCVAIAAPRFKAQSAHCRKRVLLKKSKRVGQKLCITWFPLEAKTRPRPQDCFKGPIYLLRHMKANPWWCTEGLRWLLHAAKARAAASGKGDQVVCIPAPFASNTTTVWARQCCYIYCQSHTTIITTTTISTSMSAAWEIRFVLGAGVCGCLPDHSSQPKFKPNATVPCCPILRPGPKDGSSSKGWSPVITGARSPLLQQYSKVWASAFENCANFGEQL